MQLKRWDFKILATDIDTAVLAKAAAAQQAQASAVDLKATLGATPEPKAN